MTGSAKEPINTKPALRPLVLDRYVPALLTWVSNKLSNSASKFYRERFGIGVTDWRVLSYLGVYRTGTAAKVSDFIGIDKAAASRSLALLRSRNFVSVDDVNGRTVTLSITDRGHQEYETILELAYEREEDLLRGFSDRERDAIINLLMRLHHNIQRDGRATSKALI